MAKAELACRRAFDRLSMSFLACGDNAGFTVANVGDVDSDGALVKTKIQPEGTAVHAGGTFWTPEDADHKAIRQWIAEGGQNN